MANLLSKLLSKPAVLELDLARGVLDVRPKNPLQAFQLLNATTMTALRDTLTEAAKDDNVKGLIVHAADGGVLSMALLDEIALEVERFGEHKPTAAWTESFGELQPSLALYKLATATKQIWVQPTGMLTISGPEASILLLRGGLEKLHVEPEFGQRHEYKSAANQYAAEEITEPHREMTQALVDSIVADAIQTIARRRSLDEDAVRGALESSPVTPERARELGLIDHVGYRDQAYEALLKEWSSTPEELRFVSRYSAIPDFAKSLISSKRKKIGLVSVRGPIVTGRGSAGLDGQSVGSDVVDEQLRAALRDDTIAAVVLDVDSPGGSAVASDFIRRSVLRVKESGRKVVARMGDVAASGGYYVSMGADEIVALPTTLTGSIGVLGGKLVTQGLYERLGLVRETVSGHENSSMMSSASKFSDEDWERLNAWLDRVYKDFTSFAAEDRGMEYDQLEALAKGRVWTGAQALERGLVDYLGGKRVAIERAAFLAGLDADDVDVVSVGPAGLLAKVMPAHSSESTGAVAAKPVTVESLLKSLMGELGIHVEGALSMPFSIKFN